MGKMPEGLRKYWAKRRKKGKHIYTTKRIYHSMRRKRGSRGGKATIPILGVMTAGALAAGVLGTGNNNKIQYAGSPAGYLTEGNLGQAATAAARNVTNAQTYTTIIVPAAVWIVGRLFLGKRRISKRISLF